MKWDAMAEVAALIILGTVAVVAMYELGVEGKEIPLSIGSGVIGYLTKSAVDIVKNEPPKN
jgi:hypothetical protein